jgi:hypothetical protein
VINGRGTMFRFWLVGWMFSLGLFEKEIKESWPYVFFVFIGWPMLLGMAVREKISPPDDDEK